MHKKKFLFLTIFIGILALETVLHTIHAMFFAADPAFNTSLKRTYQNAKWPELYINEYKQIKKLQYQPLLGWRTRMFNGDLITIDENGRRETAQSFMKGYKNVNIFGGSTLWGVGARNENTIPSYLSLMSAELNMNFKVVNYGERGYTITQSLIQLVNLLQKGQVPDLVIFYTGVNEVISAYYNGQAGIIRFKEFEEMIEFQQRSDFNKMIFSAGAFIAKNSMIYRSIKNTFTFGKRNTKSIYTGDEMSKSELDKLSVETAEDYTNTLKLIKNWSSLYGFKFACFLQPVIFSKQSPTDLEMISDNLAGNKKLEQFYQKCFAKFKSQTFDGFYDISDIFTKTEETVFLDFCHTTEAANKIIAQAILDSTYSNHF